MDVVINNNNDNNIDAVIYIYLRICRKKGSNANAQGETVDIGGESYVLQATEDPTDTNASVSDNVRYIS